ncbi:hypothetical protein A0J61_10742, partial [Choanephora cucurbitarum]
MHQDRENAKKPRIESPSSFQALTSGVTFAFNDLLVEEDEGFSFGETPLEVASFATIQAESAVQDEHRFKNPRSSYLPNSSIASLLFALLLCLRKNQLTDAACETVMLFCNMVLCLTEESFRFPMSIATFDRWCSSNHYGNTGIKEYASCTSCHAIHRYETDEDKGKVQDQVYCNDAGIFAGSSMCQNKLLDCNQYGTITPSRSFFYNSLVDTLKMFFMRNGFVESITRWKKTQTEHDVLSDIYDGHAPFVDEDDFNLLFTLNCDWFQAYKDPYSIGAIYLTIQNLPREIRNLRTNTILVCLINGPKEPKTYEMNRYLRPLVKELLVLMNGVDTPTRKHGVKVVKGALSLYRMDLPAQRKVAGFTSYNFINACHKCKKQFDSIIAGDKTRDFTDFNTDNWVKRSRVEHRQYAAEWLNTKTDSERNQKDRENGTRWSVLLDLPYFDPIRHVGVDTMHNLLLGITKKMALIWIGVAPSRNSSLPIMLSLGDLKEMQVILETKLVLPSGHAVSSIARKLPIGKGFSNFKAEEWATWLLVLSPYLLAQRLTTEAYDLWMLLVKAFRIFLSPSLTMSELDEAQKLKKAFLVGFEAVYDDKFLITPNFHNALHLKETILDYSASPSHWLFNFERYNQDIKGIRTNRKSCVERTYMEQFLMQVHSEDNAESLLDAIPAEFKETVQDQFSCQKTRCDESLLEEYTLSCNDFFLSNFNQFITGTEYAYGFEQLPPKAYLSMSLKLDKLSTDVFTCLVEYYNSVYCTTYVDAQISFGNPGSLPVDWHASKFKTIDILGNKYTSIAASRLKNRGSYALAYYQNDDGTTLRYCQIYRMLRHTITVEEDDGFRASQVHTLAYVKWFTKSDMRFHYYNNVDFQKY